MRSLVAGACPTNTSGYTGQIKAKLLYDPLGRLHEVENFVSGVAQGPTRFLYDGDTLVAEYDAAGTMLERYVHGPAAGADDPIAEYTGNSVAASARTNLYADARGSIVLRTGYVGNDPVNGVDPTGLAASRIANGGRAHSGKFLGAMQGHYGKTTGIAANLGSQSNSSTYSGESGGDTVQEDGDDVELRRHGGEIVVTGIVRDKDFQRRVGRLWARTQFSGKEWGLFVLLDESGNKLLSRDYRGYEAGACPNEGENPCMYNMAYYAARYKRQGYTVLALLHTHPGHARLSASDVAFARLVDNLVMSYGPHRGTMAFDWYRHD